VNDKFFHITQSFEMLMIVQKVPKIISHFLLRPESNSCKWDYANDAKYTTLILWASSFQFCPLSTFLCISFEPFLAQTFNGHFLMCFRENFETDYYVFECSIRRMSGVTIVTTICPFSAKCLPCKPIQIRNCLFGIEIYIFFSALLPSKWEVI
jgi:hypothetical protein